MRGISVTRARIVVGGDPSARALTQLVASCTHLGRDNS